MNEDDDVPEGGFEAIPIDWKITPCPEFHSMGDVLQSCARCGWNIEAHERG